MTKRRLRLEFSGVIRDLDTTASYDTQGRLTTYDVALLGPPAAAARGATRMKPAYILLSAKASREAAELAGHRIRVNAIEPGRIESPGERASHVTGTILRVDGGILLPQ